MIKSINSLTILSVHHVDVLVTLSAIMKSFLSRILVYQSPGVTALKLKVRGARVYIASPPAEQDIIRKLFSNPRTSQIRHLHILITSGGHVYDVQQRCDEIMEYNNKTGSMLEAATNLRLLDLDLCAFTPLDSIPTLQPSLQAANNLLVSLTGTIAVRAFSTRQHSPRRPMMHRSSNLQPTRQYFQL